MFGVAGGGVPVAEGYREIGFAILEPWNFFLDRVL
jgi:hypothetical protein